MNVVVEGPDNSGKSTLVRFLATRINIPIVKGEGPPKDENEWVDRFSKMPPPTAFVLFDRHTAVSEPIYGPILRGVSYASGHSDLLRDFYAQRRLFVYCRGRGLEGHVTDHERDTPEHLEALSKAHDAICQAYDWWALDHAHMTYRIGDDMHAVLRMVNAYAAHYISRRGRFRSTDGLTVLP